MKTCANILFVFLFLHQGVCSAQTINEMIEQLQEKRNTEKDAGKQAVILRQIANYNVYLGNADNAKLFALEALAVAKGAGNFTEQLFAELTFAKIIKNEGYGDSALLIAQNCVPLLQKIEGKKQVEFATAYHSSILAYLYIESFESDSAEKYTEKAFSLLNKNTTDPEEMKLLCNLFYTQSVILTRKVNKDEAVKAMLRSVRIAEKWGDKVNLLIVYYNYAEILTQEGGSPEAIFYSLKAAALSKELGIDNTYAKAISNAGIQYYYMGKFDSAYTYLHEGVQISKKYGFKSFDHIEALISYSGTLAALGQLDEAEKAIREALALQSLSKLTYSNFNTLVQLSNVLNKKGDYAEQLKVLQIAERLANDSKIEDCIITLKYQKMHYYAGTGNYEDAYKLLIELKRYDDSLAVHEAERKFREINLQYDTGKKDAEIALLNAQQEISSTKLSRQRILIAAAASLLLLVTVTTLIIIRRTRQKRNAELEIAKLEQLNTVYELRSNIALDMHDDIGASLSSIRMYSEAAISALDEKPEGAGMYMKKISENANEIIHNMSDIVWAINPKYDEIRNLLSRIRSFTTELCVANTIQPEFIWDENASADIPMEKRRNIYLIFKEAVNNAVKYAACKKITIRFVQNNRLLEMIISDDGIGFLLEGVMGGSGLKNMKTRAREIGAELILHSEQGKGTSVILKMPVTDLGQHKII